MLLTILERSCCTYLFFSHLLKPLQKLDRILQKISIPPEIFKQFSYPPFCCSKNLRSPPKIICPPPPPPCRIHNEYSLKARLHGRFLSQQLDAIFVALKLQLQNRRCKPGAIFSAICRRDIAGVSNMFET